MSQGAQVAVESELLTYKEAADFIRMSQTFLREAVAKGLVTHCKLGRSTRFTREDLRAFAHACRVRRATPIADGAEPERRPRYAAPDDEATLEERVRRAFGREFYKGLVGQAGREPGKP